jgi:methyl-accepting chemotaxis protein
MKALQKVGFRIVLPVIAATVIFSIALFVIAGKTINTVVENNLERIAQSKIADINTGEKRIAGDMLIQAALFSRANAVKDAYETAYQGNLNDPKKAAGRG